MRHAKIIATFGPATDSDETTRAIIRAGADVVRLNICLLYTSDAADE